MDSHKTYFVMNKKSNNIKTLYMQFFKKLNIKRVDIKNINNANI